MSTASQSAGESGGGAFSERDVLPGDSPPRPKWPLIAAAAAWGGWLVFLIVMMLMRLNSNFG